MSLILEALRKSEAERRRGHMPDLHAELPPPVPATRVAPKSTWPWLAGGVAAIALGLVAWVALAPRADVQAAAHIAAPARAVETTRADALPPVAHLQAAPGPAVAEAASAPVLASATPAPHASDPVATAARPVDDTRPESATSAAPSSAPRALPLPPPMPSSSGVLALSDLAPADRKSLPPLKLSMHMWNDDAAQRFVILDGNRLGEGDRIGDAVVTAITRDGVLLDWNGRALKVPLR